MNLIRGGPALQSFPTEHPNKYQTGTGRNGKPPDGCHTAARQPPDSCQRHQTAARRQPDSNLLPRGGFSRGWPRALQVPYGAPRQSPDRHQTGTRQPPDSRQAATRQPPDSCQTATGDLPRGGFTKGWPHQWLLITKSTPWKISPSLSG